MNSPAADVPRQDVSQEVYASARWSEIRPVWAAIGDVSPYTSSFLTAEWTECWLEHSTAGVRVEIVVFRSGSTAVGVCLLAYGAERRGPFTVRRVYLNASGERELDSTCIEFNNLLCLEGWEGTIAHSLAEYLRTRSWDELALDGFCAGPTLDALLQAFPNCEVRHDLRPSHYVDLTDIRNCGKAYEDLLGATTRKHLRQNYRNYGKSGNLSVHRAMSAEEALEMLADLAVLHADSWKQRGQPGAFASKSFTAFHECLVRRTWAQGGTQLWRIGAGEVVGYIYGLIHRGKVSFYQSGLRYTDDKRLSPGLVASACVINQCLAAGLAEYDFLAGEVNYKKSLATHKRELDWVVLERPGWKLKGIEILRKLKASARKTRLLGEQAAV